MSGSEEHNRRLEAIRNYKWTEEDVQRWKEWFRNYDEYMQKDEHDGNCYCARCMTEFTRKYK